MSQAARVEAAIAAALIEPPPDRTADQWADARRILPVGTAEPGPWRTDRVPYTRPICAAFKDPAIARVIVVMGSQMAKSETILNVIGHRFDDGPRVPCLYVGPTENQVRGFFRERVEPMIRATPSILEKMATGHDDKVTEKFIGGVRLGAAWAGSSTELASRPCGLVLVDERDRMASSTDDEGDPVTLVEARLATYPGAKLGVFSTPTIEGASPIVSLFADSTCEFWGWHCKHCGEWFRPRSSLLMYDSAAKPRDLAASARLVCPHCGVEHVDADKPALNAGGAYRPHAYDDDDHDWKPIEAAAPNPWRGFWVSGLASPWQSFGALATKLAAALKSKDPDTLQAVLNTAFGETYRAQGAAPELEEVRRAIVKVPRLQVPTWARLVTMGVDVQRSGLWYAVRAFGFDPAARAMRSHAIDHGYIHGDPEFDDVWLALARVRDADYLTTDAARRLRVDFCLVDSGYNPSTDRYRRPTHVVYSVCQRSAWRMLPSKGHSTQKAPAILSKIETLPSGKTIPGLRIWHVDTDHFKTQIHAAIRRLADEAIPTWTLHAETDDHYLEQLTAEELLITSQGRRIWKRRGKRDNHLFDCEVLALCGAWIHQAKLRQASGGDALAPAPPPAHARPATPAPGPRPGYVPRQPGRPWIPPRR